MATDRYMVVIKQFKGESMKRFKESTILIIGGGYVGLTAAGCFAEIGHSIHLVEKDPDRLAMLSMGEIPIYEPDLDRIYSKALSRGRIQLHQSLEEGLFEAEVVLLCVGTPPMPSGDPNLTIIAAAARQVARCATKDTYVVVKSTVPPGTCEALELICHDSARDNVAVSVLSNPEFLREGQSVYDSMNPDRVVVGGEGEALLKVASLYPDEMELLTLDRRGAELVKYASNAFLAVKVSFANEVAALCETLGTEAHRVLKGVGMDSRIGGDFLNPGIGWGGSCLPKDTSGMVAISRSLGLNSLVVDGAIEANEVTRGRVVDRLSRVNGGLEGAKVALLGLSFKAGTDDTRDSPALYLAQQLTLAGAVVVGYDPMAKLNQSQEKSIAKRAISIDEAVDGADIVVIGASWSQFSELSPEELLRKMAGVVVFDGVGVLDLDRYAQAGFVAMGVGRGHQDRFKPIIWRPLSWTIDDSPLVRGDVA